jgi:hypothetical protein
VTIAERQDVVYRAHEAGAFDECWAEYSGWYDACSREEYLELCQEVATRLFADGWVSRFLWRRAVRAILEENNVMLGWKLSSSGERYAGFRPPRLVSG